MEADSIALFGEKLRRDGLSAKDAAVKIEELRRGLIAEEGEFYDDVYAQGPKFTPEPNRLLVEAIEDRAQGKALDVGMGQGRNAIFLASRGWSVTGFDPSAVGLEQARAAAERSGLKIRTVLSGAEYFDFGREI